MEITKKDFDGQQWLLDQPLTVTVAGNVIDISQSRQPSGKVPVMWLDSDTYVDTRSGEVLECQHSQHRGEAMSIPELRRTFKRMRGLINSNFFGDENELFITLTYAENMQDVQRLQYDLQKFMSKVKRALGEIKYLSAVEPQQRGAWHAHLLVKQMTAHRTYWPAEEIAEAWQHGFVHVQRLEDCDNVGAYLSAYLSNVPEVDQQQRPLQDVPKKVIKGARLHWYKKGTHIYRASQNLERPIVKKIRPYSSEHRRIMNCRLCYSRQLDLSDSDTGKSINQILQAQFNIKK